MRLRLGFTAVFVVVKQWMVWGFGRYHCYSICYLFRQPDLWWFQVEVVPQENQGEFLNAPSALVAQMLSIEVSFSEKFFGIGRFIQAATK